MKNISLTERREQQSIEGYWERPINVFIAMVKAYMYWTLNFQSRVYVEFVWIEGRDIHLYGGFDYAEQYKFVAVTVRGKIVKSFYGVSKDELIDNYTCNTCGADMIKGVKCRIYEQPFCNHINRGQKKHEP